jgi:hypothetical protein
MKWTYEQIRELRKLHEQNYTAKDISISIGISYAKVLYKMKKLGLERIR